MQNPFETGQIKNYVLLYVGVVVIMILFFIATTLFHENREVEKKVFKTAVPTQKTPTAEVKKKRETQNRYGLKLLPQERN